MKNEFQTIFPLVNLIIYTFELRYFSTSIKIQYITNLVRFFTKKNFMEVPNKIFESNL